MSHLFDMLTLVQWSYNKILQQATVHNETEWHLMDLTWLKTGEDLKEKILGNQEALSFHTSTSTSIY